jgi:hypothetical protein
LIAVAFSFRQTIFAFPGGGGAYVVTARNLADRQLRPRRHPC